MAMTWAKFWAEYPDYGTSPDSAAVKAEIGGEVDAAWIVNTCAVRMSRGLNYGGVPLPSKFAGLLTLKGADGKRYALRVAEMRKWLPTSLGAASFNLTKKAGEAFDKTQIAAMKGIIAFDIQFADATGHLDAWDGSSFSSEYKNTKDYWTLATRVTLWKLA
ncbi:type VI secretion system amidase effector protein Tae4 [Isosphaeraceae bacterium EP7]